jgi:hypothetical protein
MDNDLNADLNDDDNELDMMDMAMPKWLGIVRLPQ